MILGNTIKVPRNAPAPLKALMEMAAPSIKNHFCSEHYNEIVKVRDQLAGGRAAIQEKYHPKLPGLVEQQQARLAEIRKFSHYNAVAPARDRLVNAIHSGKIFRTIEDERHADIQSLIKSPSYSEHMVRLCENAFTFGTGYLLPIYREGTFTFRHLNALSTVLIASPDDVSDVQAVIECSSKTDYSEKRKFYIATPEWEAVLDEDSGQFLFNETAWGFLPLSIAYGQEETFSGSPYGKSLVLPAANASIQVTTNNVNLLLARDLQTHALCVIKGKPASTSEDDKESLQKYVVSNDPAFSVDYVTPESRLDHIEKVRESILKNAAASMGLPLDVYLPELVAGTDASATAARSRAFPLTQKLSRLINKWQQVEESTVSLLARLSDFDRGIVQDSYNVGVRIKPSVPESESETLSNYIQLVQAGFIDVMDPIEFYSEDKTDEVRARLLGNAIAKRQAQNTNSSTI